MSAPRFIPAPAGNRLTSFFPGPWQTIHPRACGEQVIGNAGGTALVGSSPRLRGTVLGQQFRLALARFIPAPAGNSRLARKKCTDSAVHPRACGEQAVQGWCGSSLPGSSPRLRGTAIAATALIRKDRFIPAPAGNSRRPRPRRPAWSVHPRACGEQLFISSGMYSQAGSSPRLRGTDNLIERASGKARFIPAPAGNSVFSTQTAARLPVHPRACGEQPALDSASAGVAGSSPRLRGTVANERNHSPRDRFIPAPAGNSRLPFGRWSIHTVHPRACGEQRGNHE